MFTSAIRRLGLCLTAMAVLGCVPCLAGADQVPVDCTTLAQWTKRPRPPQVNQIGVFCGERQHKTLRGFHSRPGGLVPDSVTRFTMCWTSSGALTGRGIP